MVDKLDKGERADSAQIRVRPDFRRWLKTQAAAFERPMWAVLEALVAKTMKGRRPWRDRPPQWEAAPLKRDSFGEGEKR